MPVVAQERKRATVTTTGREFDSHSQKNSGNEAKRGVKFHHSACNVSELGENWEPEVS